MLAELVSYSIVGHHTGLPDYGSMGDVAGDGTLLARREKTVLKDYSAYRSEIYSSRGEFHYLASISTEIIRGSRFRS